MEGEAAGIVSTFHDPRDTTTFDQYSIPFNLRCVRETVTSNPVRNARALSGENVASMGVFSGSHQCSVLKQLIQFRQLASPAGVSRQRDCFLEPRSGLAENLNVLLAIQAAPTIHRLQVG